MRSQQISENAIQQWEEASFKLSKKYLLELEAIIVRLPYFMSLLHFRDFSNHEGIRSKGEAVPNLAPVSYFLSHKRNLWFCPWNPYLNKLWWEIAGNKYVYMTKL